MSSLLSAETITAATGAFASLFDTLSLTEIIVHKQPIEIINSGPTFNPLPGYNDTDSTPAQISYQYVSGIFHGIVIDPKTEKGGKGSFLDNKIVLSPNQIAVKVDKPCRDYINIGKTEGIQVNDLMWSNVGRESVQNFLGKKYYYFILDSSN